MVTTTDLQHLHTAVWSFRDSMEPYGWTTPCPMDALRFAVTEAAEALDAWLRLNPRYKRNRERQERIEAELADCAIMLITALGRDYQYKANDIKQYRPGLESIMYIVNHALWVQDDWTSESLSHYMCVEVALWNVLGAIGNNYEHEIMLKMEKLHTKHAKKAIDKSISM